MTGDRYAYYAGLRNGHDMDAAQGIDNKLIVPGIPDRTRGSSVTRRMGSEMRGRCDAERAPREKGFDTRIATKLLKINLNLAQALIEHSETQRYQNPLSTLFSVTELCAL